MIIAGALTSKKRPLTIDRLRRLYIIIEGASFSKSRFSLVALERLQVNLSSFLQLAPPYLFISFFKWIFRDLLFIDLETRSISISQYIYLSIERYRSLLSGHI